MDSLSISFNIDRESEVKSLKILINQCWKTLPIYEGKGKDGSIVYSKEVAYDNFQKHLDFLIMKLSGASKVWFKNQHYIELLYMLLGMKTVTKDEHAKVKYIVNHCTNLINSMIEEVNTYAS